MSLCLVRRALLLSALVSVAAAQSVKVSAPMPYSPLANGENVFESDFAGTRVVYRADQDTHGLIELYSAPRDGSQPPVKLSPVLPAAGDVLSFVVSPDGATVLFQTDDARYGPRTLRRVPSDGSAPAATLATNLFHDSDELFYPGDATPFDAPRFTPDGTRVVYMKGNSTYQGELFTIPLAGGTERRLAVECQWFQLSPDGTRAVYHVANGSQNFLYSVRLASGGAVALSAAFGETELRFRPDGWLVYRANYPTGTASLRHDLYTVPLDGSVPPLKLNPPLTAQQRVREFELTSDGTRVVYVADHARQGVFELFVVPVDGSAPPQRLSGPMPDLGDVAGSPPFALLPGGREVVFRANKVVLEGFDLYRVPLGGSAPPRPLGLPNVGHYALDPAGLRLVYLTGSGPEAQLFSVPLAVPPHAQSLTGAQHSNDPVRLNGALVPGGGVLDFTITTDSRGVVYTAHQDSLQLELYRAPIGGGNPPVKLNAPLVAGGNVGANAGPAYRVSADATRALYAADQETDLLVELYSVPLDRSLAPVKLNGPLELGPPAGDVREFGFGPDGARFAYSADGTLDEAFELYARDVAGATPVVRLGPGLGYPQQWSFSLDGTRVIEAADKTNPGSQDLYSIPSDGSTSPLLLENASAAVANFVLTPDGDSLVYSQGKVYTVPILGGTAPRLLSGSVTDPQWPQVTSDGRYVVFDSLVYWDYYTYRFRIFSVPFDGSAPPREISGEMPFNRSTSSRQLSPRGGRVVFTVDKETMNRWELYSVPVDGRAPPTRISGAMQPEGDVWRFLVSPDGQRVVYQADQDLDRLQELYSVPIDGDPPLRRPGGPALAPRVKLNGPLPAPGLQETGIRAFDLDPTGSIVAFSVEDAADHAQLYAVPIDRRTDPVLLSLGASDVPLFVFSPDGARVVYSAFETAGGALELFSVPADGSLAPVKLTGPLVSGGGLYLAVLGGNFEVSPDGHWVVYVADQDVDEHFELYARAIDGSGSALRLNDPLGPNADVQGYTSQNPFAISPDSRWVLYSADEDLDEVFELYRVALP